HGGTSYTGDMSTGQQVSQSYAQNTVGSDAQVTSVPASHGGTSYTGDMSTGQQVSQSYAQKHGRKRRQVTSVPASHGGTSYTGDMSTGQQVSQSYAQNTVGSGLRGERGKPRDLLHRRHEHRAVSECGETSVPASHGGTSYTGDMSTGQQVSQSYAQNTVGSDAKVSGLQATVVPLHRRHGRAVPASHGGTSYTGDMSTGQQVSQSYAQNTVGSAQRRAGPAPPRGNPPPGDRATVKRWAGVTRSEATAK
ncbi:MAG: hypothetical protein IPM93_07215, partial [Candidatus Obscuribacter sp.]|nr:hypothetical protein [Candidatus Obscuribacter sp.]